MVDARRIAWAACLLALMLGRVATAAAVDLQGDALPSGAVARIGSARLAGSAREIAYSPDGKYVFSAFDSIRVWNAATGQLIREMARTPGSVVHTLAISPDGRLVARNGATRRPGESGD